MSTINKLIAILAMVLATSALSAQNYTKLGVDTTKGIPTGLQTGAIAPDFSGADQQGNQVQLAEILDEKQQVVLFFYRGYWCGLCNKYLKAYQDSLNMIEGPEVKVIGITAEKPANVDKTVDETGAEFSILFDKDGKIMEKYGVNFHVTDKYQDMITEYASIDLKNVNDQKQVTLPVPATYIINSNRKITYRHFDVDYSDRAYAREIIENL